MEVMDLAHDTCSDNSSCHCYEDGGVEHAQFVVDLIMVV